MSWGDQVKIRVSLLAAAYLLASLSLLWPAFVLGHPIVSPDTPAYFKAGDLAVRLIWESLSGAIDWVIGGPGEHTEYIFGAGGTNVSEGTEASLVPEDAVGVRSAYYGLIVRILGDASLWPIAAGQAAFALYAIHRFISTFAPFGSRSAILIVFMLAVVSSLPWFVSYVMPDVLSGISILLISTLLFQRNRLGPRVILIDCALILFCLVSHFSNLLLAMALSIVAFGAAAVFRNASWARLLPIRTVFLAVILGVAVVANAAVNYVAFGTVALTARNPPFLLARSIVDGPGRPYLEEICHKPHITYFICRHLGELPRDVNVFLWDPHSVYMAARPDQRARLRAEEREIVLNAAIAYPWLQLRSSLGNAWHNLATFHVRDTRADLVWHNDEQGYRVFEGDAPTTISVALAISSNVIYSSTLISLVLIAVLAFRFGSCAVPPVALFVLLALLGNAAVTGVFSSDAPRYQARVIWLVPLIAIACMAAAFRTHARRSEV